MEHKNILVDLLPVLPGGTNGGAKVWVLELLQNMCAATPNTHWTILVQPNLNTDFISLPNVRFVAAPGYQVSILFRLSMLMLNKLENYLTLAQYKKLYLWLDGFRMRAVKKKQYKFDLLFCPFTDPVLYKKNIPTVTIIYDLQFLTYPEFFSYPDFLHRQQVIHRACAFATKIITISDYSKNRVIAMQKLPADKIKTIYIGRSKQVVTTDDTILAQWDLKPQQYLIYPANFWKHKNHERLFIAFNAALREQKPQLKLVLTGAPCARQEFLKIYLQKSQLDKDIIMLDYVANDELSILLNNSLALIFPSLYEGFGMPIVEAMALGVPVLCSNVTALPEIAGDACLQFAPQSPASIKNAILEIYQNDKLRAELIQKGHQQATKFLNKQKITQEYLDILASTLRN